MKQSANLTISAVICTRDRPALLKRALKSLSEQSVPADSIIVIDNAPSSNETETLVKSDFPQVSYYQEPLPGLDFARNTAVAVCHTDLIAFLDDDAVADKNWLISFLKAFQSNPELGACTGRVEALSTEAPSQKLFEANGGFGRGKETITLPKKHTDKLHGLPAPDIAWAISIGNGCSMAIKKNVLMKTGNFDEALDLGSPLPGGGDLDMLWRILSTGFSLQYVPEALAFHEHRTNMPAMIAQMTGHQRALIAFLVKTITLPSQRSRFPIFIFLLWRLAKPGFRILRKVFRGDPLPYSVLLKMWKECFAGLFAYQKSKNLVLTIKQELS